ncbi:MAG: alpha/beta hydrolase [Planctomycetota bacterium]
MKLFYRKEINMKSLIKVILVLCLASVVWAMQDNASSVPTEQQKIILSSSLSSKTIPSEKQVFVYKTVNGHKIKANIFLPETKDKCPVLVFFHGGFVFGNRDQGLNIHLKEKLLAHNYAVVSADYRLAPETKINGMLEDVKDVIKWLRTNGHNQYHIDPNRIAVAGGSAGGYLALTSGFKKKSAPNAIIAISPPTGFSKPAKMGDLSILNQPGPYDIVTDKIISYGDYSKRMDLWRFLARHRLFQYEVFGFDPSKESDKLEKYKLQNNINSNYPPTLIIHARNDHLVDLNQVNAFYEFLQEKEVITELYLVENGHSTKLINQHPDAVDKIISFLEMHCQL